MAANYGIGLDGDDCVLPSIASLRRVVAENIDDVMDEDAASAYVIRSTRSWQRDDVLL